MATMNQFLCIRNYERLYHGKCHTKECKDNLLITNYNQTLKTFNTLIQCMFSEYSGSLNGRHACDKGFLIAIQAKRYKVFFSTSMSYLLMNVTRTVIRCYFVLFMLTIWTSSMSNTIIRGEKYQNSKFIRYLCFKSEEKELNTSRCNLRRQERS